MKNTNTHYIDASKIYDIEDYESLIENIIGNNFELQFENYELKHVIAAHDIGLSTIECDGILTVTDIDENDYINSFY